MTVFGSTSKIWKSALGVVFMLASITSGNAQTPPPYLLPYTITTIAGGGTAPKAGAACPGALGTTGNLGSATDTSGNGCLASSSSVVTSVDVHDVGVDSEGNVYFIDNSSPVMIRRIDAHSGLITLFAGSTSTAVCTSAIDKYGDSCLASDGNGNQNGKFTSLTTARGLAVAKNGDVYLAHYSAKIINKISASTGLMTLVAGALTGTPGAKNSATGGYTGDGGPATSAEENQARGVTADTAGNIYIADSSNNVVRMVNASGVISTIVGKYPGSNTNAPASFTGDGGPATAATLNTPEDVDVDADGNVFVADQGNSRVRVVYAGGPRVAALIAATNGGAVAAAGNIYTIMGGGTGTYSPGSIVLATSVAVAAPRKIAIDNRGNIFLADNGNNVIWFEDGTTGYMRVVAGSFGLTTGGPGCPGKTNPLGDNCQATSATLNPNSAMGVGVDSQGNIYISDSGDQRIRKVSVNQNFPTVAAGSSVTHTLVLHFAVGDTPATTSAFTVAGNTDFVVAPGSCNNNPDNTTDCPITVTFSPNQPGQDFATLVVKSALGTTTQLGLSGIGAAASVALDPGTATGLGTGYKSPVGIAVDAVGNSYVADTGNNVVLRYDSAGTGTIIAGTAGTAGNGGNGGPATAATLSAPSAVTVTPDGAVYIADTGNSLVRRIDPVTGVINIAAGGATATCAVALDTFGNGCLGTQAKLSAPTGLASDFRGNVYISDTGNNVVRELTSSGYIFAIGGAVFSAPAALQVDGNSNIFVADTGHNNISEITSKGTVVTVAGNGQNGSSGNGGPATAANLSGPTGVAMDAANNLYIADTGNHVIRLVNAAGTINTVAGTLGQSGSGTLPASVNTLLLNLPHGIASTTSGKLYVLDSGNNRAYTIDRTSVVESLGTAAPNSSSPVQTIQQTNTGSIAALLSPSSSQPIFTGTGDTTVFSVTPQGSLGCSGGQNLTPGATCLLGAQFNPVAFGSFNATFTEASITPALPVTPSIKFSGVGANLSATTAATVLTSPATGNPQFGNPFTVTTTVTPVQCNTAAPSCVPTGTVQFSVGTTPVGIPVALNSTGAASTSISGQNVGTLTVTAVYKGDSFYGSSTAPPLSVTVTTGSASVVVSLSTSSLPQFQPLTITAKASSASGGIPTGTITFFADGKSIGTSSLDATGIASIVDPLPGNDPSTGNPFLPNSFGLFAGTHAITAAYGGDTNYTKSTSPAVNLTIQPDAASFTSAFISPITLGKVNSLSAGTAQGSTALATVVVTPTNTLDGTVTFACSGLPANSVCTVTPTSLTFSPVPGVPTPLTVGVTLWTDVAPGVIPTATSSRAIRPANVSSHTNTALATILGWPLLLTSFAGILGFNKRLRKTRLLAVLLLFGLLTGSSMMMSGCNGSSGGSSGGLGTPSLTPTGKYNVSLTVSGPNSTTQTMPIQFTVGPGVPGQE